jgi:hypothetical protein
MAETYLAIIILALIGYIIYLNKQHERETSQLLDRIMAKNLAEFQAKTVPLSVSSPEKPPSDLVAMPELTEEEFDKMIRQQAGEATATEKAVKSLKQKLTRK